MVIWMGSGRGLMGLLSPIFRFSWPVMLAMGALVLLAWPWANQQTDELRDRFAQRSDLQRVQPGQFQTDAQGSRVFFIDKDTADGTQGRNVFISSSNEQGETIISARAATLDNTPQGQFLLLKNGQRLQTGTDPQNLQISQFEEYRVQVNEKPFGGEGSLAMKSRATWDLLADTSLAARAEMVWRVGMVLVAFNLLLLALAVTTGNPRAGRSGNIAFTLFAFLLYYNLLNMGESWVGQGRVSPAVWLLMLHGTVFVLSAAWLYKRHENISLLAMWRARTQQVAS
jgi:lipopolysaccharide export system permease protein